MEANTVISFLKKNGFPVSKKTSSKMVKGYITYTNGFRVSSIYKVNPDWTPKKKLVNKHIDTGKIEVRVTGIDIVKIYETLLNNGFNCILESNRVVINA